MCSTSSCRFFALLFSSLSLLTLFAGCGSGGSGGTQTPPQQSSITSVAVSPSSAIVQPKGTQAFQVTVTGTGNYSSAVNWSVNGVAGGNQSLGTISSVGLYTAPVIPPNPNTVTIAATSVQDSTKKGSGSLQIGTSAFNITGIQLTPMAATINTGWSQQFTTLVSGTGTFDNSVTFSVNGITGGNSNAGTIDSTGKYVAPSSVPPGGSVSVTAASTAAPAISATATVTITRSNIASPVITQLSPATADAGQQIQILGTGFNGGGQTTSTVIVVFTGPNGISIPVQIFEPSNSDTSRDATVPLGASDGPVYVIVQDSAGPQYKSNNVQFTRTPRVRIRATQRDLSSGESTTMQWRKLAGSQPVTLEWTADVGSVSPDGVYTAPSGLTTDSFAVVKACIQGTASCDQQRLGLHPFRVSPDAPSIASGQSIQLQAMQGSSILSPSWSLAGPGTLNNSGQYTSTGQFADAGEIPFVATQGPFSQSGFVQVLDAFPGLVNRISDYFDEHENLHVYGTFPDYVGVIGNRLYVDATFGFYPYSQPGNSFPVLADLRDVDIYDITDPAHPVWLDAFEPLTIGKPTLCDGRLYMYANGDQNYGNGAITVYDISGATPQPLQRVFLPPQPGSHARSQWYAQSGCSVAEFPGLPNSFSVQTGTTAALTLRHFQAGGVTDSQYAIPIPPYPSGFASFYGFATDGNRFYIDLDPSTGQPNLQLLTYDLTPQTPTLLSTVPTEPLTMGPLRLVGNLLFATIDDGIYYPRTNVYDVSNSTPSLLTTLPTGQVRDASGTSVLASTIAMGPRVVDVSNPQVPALKTLLSDYSEMIFDMSLSGKYAFEVGYGGGVSVWDVGEPGGLLPKILTPDSLDAAVPTAIVSNATDMFVTSLSVAGYLSRFDLKQSPPKRTSQVLQDNLIPLALALSGPTLYEGTQSSLQVFDVSGSGDPSSITSLDVPVSALAVSGSTLFAGTLDNRLIVFSISQPQSPTQIASVSLPGSPDQILVSGNLAFIADDLGGFLIYNVATPTAPLLLSHVTQFPAVAGVAVDGNLALLAAREYGLVILDIGNPALPAVVGKASVDTTNPFVSSYLMYNKAFAISVVNKIAYIGINNFDSTEISQNGSTGIFGFDYRDPHHPRLVSRNSFGNIDTFVWTLANSPVGLICGCSSSLLALDTSQPFNSIGSFGLPDALRAPQAPDSISPQSSLAHTSASAPRRLRQLRYLRGANQMIFPR